MSYAGVFAMKRRVGNEMAETRRELALLKEEVNEQYVSLSLVLYVCVYKYVCATLTMFSS